MQHDTNNTENNFSLLENDAEADLSQIDNHWEKMKNTLAMQAPQMVSPKKWLWVSVPIIVIIGLLLFFASKNSKAIEENKLAKAIKIEIADTISFKKDNDTIKHNTIVVSNSGAAKRTNLSIAKISLPSKVFTKQSILASESNGKTKKGENVNTNTQIANANVPIIKDSTKVENNVEHAQKIEMLNDFIAKIQKKGELFTISNLRDTTIKAAEGTVFYIPMNSFNTTDSVVFEVKEYYKYSDMVVNGLTTMADDKQLISGGMLSLNATVKGKEVVMNPSKEIRVFIPNLTAKDSMKIFEGKKRETQDFNLQKNTVIAQNNINWQLTKVRIDSAVLKMFIRAIDLKDDQIHYTTTNFGNKTKAVFHRALSSKLSKSELLVLLKKKYGDYYDKIRVHNQWKRDLLFRNNEALEEEYYHLAYNSWGVGDTAELLPISIRIYKLTPIDTVYKILKWISKGYVTTNRPLFSTNILSMVGEKYSIGINKLGWINCDRFYNYKGKKSSINVDLKDSAHLFVTYMVFEKLKIIVKAYENGNMALFSNIPMGEPVKIISIGVKDNKTVTAIKSIITTNEEIQNLSFKSSTTLDFTESLKILDKPQN
jgi:hypothetical protein